jgi:hypothetical protein
MERVMVLTGRFDIRKYPVPHDALPSVVSPLIERVGIGVFALLLGFVLVGLWMVFVQGVPLPLEAICLRG